MHACSRGFVLTIDVHAKVMAAINTNKGRPFVAFRAPHCLINRPCATVLQGIAGFGLVSEDFFRGVRTHVDPRSLKLSDSRRSFFHDRPRKVRTRNSRRKFRRVDRLSRRTVLRRVRRLSTVDAE